MMVSDMGVSVSIVLCTYNVEDYVSNCLKAILGQTFSDFELLIIDDSTDNTGNIIRMFNDPRIKYFKGEERLGLAKSRNKGIKLSTGNYVFFTDADCVVSRDWLAQGMRSFASGCVGVEGRTVYVSEDYKPTFSDSVIKNQQGGQFMTCNIAYKKSVLERVGGFDERYDYYEDRDLAFRVKRFGKIVFNPSMVVYHQKMKITPRNFIRRANRIRNRVLLFKRFRDVWSGRIPNPLGRIINPLDFLVVFCPVLILSYLAIYRFKSREDWNLFPYIWIKKVYERISLWHACALHKVFLI